MAHWLSWKAGIGLVASRQHVRVGRALEHLPQIADEFAHGRLSFSKVRALTRIATPSTEGDLVEFAKVTTAAQLEAAIRGYERTRVDADTARKQRAARTFRLFHEDDGTVVVIARMTRDAAENLLAAVKAAEAEVPRIDGDDSAESRRADALELIATHFLAGRSERVPTEVVVHVDADQVDGDERSPVLERFMCDTAIRIHAPHASGRRTRTVSVALRRAIEHRDQHCCRFPGCSNQRFLHVHHIVHFARGGATDESNCALLCTFHHQAVHEGGWRVFGDARQHGQLIFLNPRGRRVHERVELPAATRAVETIPGIDAMTIATADGGRMDLDHAITALVSREGRPPSPN
jgi:hypothetical protein